MAVFLTSGLSDNHHIFHTLHDFLWIIFLNINCYHLIFLLCLGNHLKKRHWTLGVEYSRWIWSCKPSIWGRRTWRICFKGIMIKNSTSQSIPIVRFPICCKTTYIRLLLYLIDLPTSFFCWKILTATVLDCVQYINILFKHNFKCNFEPNLLVRSTIIYETWLTFTKLYWIRRFSFLLNFGRTVNFSLYYDALFINQKSF